MTACPNGPMNDSKGRVLEAMVGAPDTVLAALGTHKRSHQHANVQLITVMCLADGWHWLPHRRPARR